MAVGDYTYGTEEGVEAKVGWVVPDRDFTDSTTPTDSQVHTILDQVAAEVHAKLTEAGYPVQTKANVETNAPRALNWLIMLNEAGASAMVLQSFAIAGDPEAVSTPAGYWKKIYEDGLNMIKGRFLDELGLARTTQLSELLVGTSVDDTDGNRKKPIFKRDTFDYPSSRTLTEEED